MPVRFTPSGDHHEREDYSFYIRDHGSRNFARSRRFGEEGGDDARAMSLVSSPLQVPLIGRRRSASPMQRHRSPIAEKQYPGHEDEVADHRGDSRPVNYRARQASESNRNYGYEFEYDDIPLQPIVPTYQPRMGRPRCQERHQAYGSQYRRQPEYFEQQEPQQYSEDGHEDRRDGQRDERRLREEQFLDEQQHQQQRNMPANRQQRQDEELQSLLNWRKRSQEPLVHTDFGYEVPPMRKRVDPMLQDEEDNFRSVVGYIAKRRQFAVEDDEDMQHYRNPNYQYRLHGIDRPLVTEKDVEDSMERSKLDRAPMFDMKLRSHVVWEKMNVKFTCTVRGSPTPRVTWYKDMVPLEPSLHSPGKYKISNQFGLHTLEIYRAAIEDSGTYRVSMQNRKGEISSYATLLVRRYDGGRIGYVDVKSGYNMKKPTDYPDVEGLNVLGRAPHAGKIEVKEYDELPETEASRHFKAQLDNLDFDVNKLIKEAKLDKEIEGFESKSRINSKADMLSTSIVDGALADVRKTSEDHAHDAALKISGLATVVNGERRGSGYISGDDGAKGYLSDVSTDNSEPSAHKSRYKVAIEVNVTNEKRRDSLDPFEKLIAAEKRNESDKKDTDAKQDTRSVESDEKPNSQQTKTEAKSEDGVVEHENKI